MGATTVTGTILGVDNAALVGVYVTFRLKSTGTDSVATSTIDRDAISVITDASGQFSTTLWDNGDSGVTSILEIRMPSGQRHDVIIPAGDAAIDIWDLIENYTVGTADPQLPTNEALFMRKADNLSDVADVPTSRTNLGLGTAATTAATDYATAAQGTLADSALQASDIGLTVQAQSAVLDATTASYTTAEQTKLSGIEALADVTDATNVVAAGGYIAGGTDVAIADGGTGASTEAAARTNLEFQTNVTGAVTAVGVTSYTVLTTDHTLTVDDTAIGGNVTINLPAAATATSGFDLVVKKTGSTYTVTLDGDGAETIDGAATYALTVQNESARVTCDGAGWNLISTTPLPIETTITDNDNAIPTSGAVVDYSQPKLQSTILVTQASDLAGTLDSTKVYYVDGVVDMGSQTIEVPANGLSIVGSTFDISQLTSSENTYDMFTSPVGGSGNLVLKDVGITTSGTSSSVFALTDATGFNAIEIKVVNFNSCTSMGYLDGYRQGLESGTGRFGGTPELEFRNTWTGGYRTETTIARGMSNFTSLFKAGTGFNYAGRVILGMNCDLPVTGAFCDFSASNIGNDESLQLSDCRMTRAGALDASDTTIYPNIDHTNVKCLWSDNAGLPVTTKYIKANITTEIATTISASTGVSPFVQTYYPLAGTFTVETNSHLDMPSNGEFRLQSGNGTYQIAGDFVIDGPTSDEVNLRVTKSTDGGSTWPTEITVVRREVNAFVGSRDVAFFPVNFITTLQEDDRIRIEVSNESTAGNLTAELDSYFIVTAL